MRLERDSIVQQPEHSGAQQRSRRTQRCTVIAEQDRTSCTHGGFSTRWSVRTTVYSQRSIERALCVRRSFDLDGAASQQQAAW